MKKVIPFKKNILFKTNLSEITSISLEDNLKFDNNIVLGNFVVSGEYKMNDSSINTEPFNYDIPVEINIDEKYNLNKSTVEVSDFYYENKIRQNGIIKNADNAGYMWIDIENEGLQKYFNKEIEMIYWDYWLTILM